MVELKTLNELPIGFNDFKELTVSKKDLKNLAKTWINNLEKLTEEHSQMVAINEDHKIDKEDFGLWLITKLFNINGEEI